MTNIAKSQNWWEAVENHVRPRLEGTQRVEGEFQIIKYLIVRVDSPPHCRIAINPLLYIGYRHLTFYQTNLKLVNIFNLKASVSMHCLSFVTVYFPFQLISSNFLTLTRTASVSTPRPYPTCFYLHFFQYRQYKCKCRLLKCGHTLYKLLAGSPGMSGLPFFSGFLCAKTIENKDDLNRLASSDTTWVHLSFFFLFLWPT